MIAQAIGAREVFDQWYPDAAPLSDAQRHTAFARFQRINSAFGNRPFDEKAERSIQYPAQAPLLRPRLEQLLDAADGK